MKRIALALLSIIAVLSLGMASAPTEAGAAPTKDPAISITARVARDCTSVTLTGKFSNFPPGPKEPSLNIYDWTLSGVPAHENFPTTSATRGSYTATFSMVPDPGSPHHLGVEFQHR
jgi:hypothetical protein